MLGLVPGWNDEMIQNATTDAIMVAGMNCLMEKLGVVEAEMFLAMIRENTFDYTEWRRDNLWQGMSIDEIFQLAAEREKERMQELEVRSLARRLECRCKVQSGRAVTP